MVLVKFWRCGCNAIFKCHQCGKIYDFVDDENKCHQCDDCYDPGSDENSVE